MNTQTMNTQTQEIQIFIKKYMIYCRTISSFMDKWTKEQRKTLRNLKYNCSMLGLGILLDSFIKTCHCGGEMYWDRTDKGRAACCRSCEKEEFFIKTYEENYF